MLGFFRKAVAFALVSITLAVSVPAQTERAILYPGNNVDLNGNSIQTSSAVMSGDKVHTGDGQAQLTGRGLLTIIEKNSTMQYGDVLLLECGSMLVSSSTFSVQASDTRVTPNAGTAKYHIVNRGGKLTIEVQSGSVRVSADETTVLAAGQSVERLSHDGCPVLGAEKPEAAASGGRRKIVGLILAGGGAGAAGIIFAERNKKPVSPSGP
jgi:hypothetical protein